MNPRVDLHLGDCLDVLRTLPSGSVDAVVTDPPAGIGFMGKTWDKPGVLGVSGGRAMPATMASRNPICKACRKHVRGKPPRPVCSCESPDIDTSVGVVRERTLFIDFLTERMAEARRVTKVGGYALVWALPRTSHWTGMALEDAGWVIRDRVTHLFGSGFPKGKACLKPAAEDWWLAWNPAKHVTPLNIDDCRIPTSGESLDGGRVSTKTDGWDRPWKHDSEAVAQARERIGVNVEKAERLGRWPANVTHDGSDEVLEAFAAFGESVSRKGKPRGSESPGVGWGMTKTGSEYDDTGSAARFFYCAKASPADRGEDNTHPTVKNTELMRWLIRLATQPGEVVLDAFMGSGSTGKAAVIEGRSFIGMEQNPEYLEIARRRIAAAFDEMPLFARG